MDITICFQHIIYSPEYFRNVYPLQTITQSNTMIASVSFILIENLICNFPQISNFPL